MSTSITSTQALWIIEQHFKEGMIIQCLEIEDESAITYKVAVGIDSLIKKHFCKQKDRLKDYFKDGMVTCLDCPYVVVRNSVNGAILGLYKQLPGKK